MWSGFIREVLWFRVLLFLTLRTASRLPVFFTTDSTDCYGWGGAAGGVGASPAMRNALWPRRSATVLGDYDGDKAPWLQGTSDCADSSTGSNMSTSFWFIKPRIAWISTDKKMFTHCHGDHRGNGSLA